MNVALFLEIKNEYTEHLVDTLTPYIYEGLSSIYKQAVNIAYESNAEDKILLIFQKLLQSVDSWNQLKIDEETNRIKQLSNTADYLDDLVKAVIKSNIILLTYSNSISNIIGQTVYSSITTSTFVHRCYTECAKDVHNNPFLFYHKVKSMEAKRSQIIVQQNIQTAIIRAVRKILPIGMILKEYLLNSVNIIYEPPKVELLGMPANPLENLVPMPACAMNVHPVLSEKKIDSKLEKEVMQILKSDYLKSDKQRIQAIMNIDKIITSAIPNDPGELSAKKIVSSITKNRHSEPMIPPHLIEQDDDDNDDDDHAMNSRLGKSDRKVINIDFDEEPTIEGSNKKTLSGTTISTRPQAKNPSRSYTETSERIDPSKTNIIEDYGAQNGGSHRNNRQHSRHQR